jgi:hypothetical protein
MAGICGRAWNMAGMGLNHYVLILAETGTGKEAAKTGIAHLIGAVGQQVPSAMDFIGPGSVASGQGLMRYISNSKTQCFVSVIGEFGLQMQMLSNPRLSNAELMFKKMILDLYHKSGKHGSVDPAAYSDKSNNIATVKSPAFSLLGESVPSRFYGSLSEDMVSDGFIPRFICVEYKGERPEINHFSDRAKPSFQLVNSLADLCAYALNRMHNNQTVDVQIAGDIIGKVHAFEKLTSDKIRNVKKNELRHLWNRAYVKTLRLAALAAVACCPHDPVIDDVCFEWAKSFVMADVMNMVGRFNDGTIVEDASDDKQRNRIIATFNQWIKTDWNGLKAYGIGNAQLHKAKVIPHSFIMRRLIAAPVFRNDKQGASTAIKRGLRVLIDEGAIVECGKQIVTTMGFNGICYMINDVNLLE